MIIARNYPLRLRLTASVLAACSALALAGCDSAQAMKPMTFACTSVEMRGPAFDNRFGLVDRVTVDFKSPSLHFAVSDTMGKAVEVDWTYENGPPPFPGWPEHRVAVSVDGDGTIHATAMRTYTM